MISKDETKEIVTKPILKERMTAFGIPIVSKIEGDFTLEDLQKSISKKLSGRNILDFVDLDALEEDDVNEAI